MLMYNRSACMIRLTKRLLVSIFIWSANGTLWAEILLFSWKRWRKRIVAYFISTSVKSIGKTISRSTSEELGDSFWKTIPTLFRPPGGISRGFSGWGQFCDLSSLDLFSGGSSPAWLTSTVYFIDWVWLIGRVRMAWSSATLPSPNNYTKFNFILISLIHIIGILVLYSLYSVNKKAHFIFLPTRCKTLFLLSWVDGGLFLFHSDGFKRAQSYTCKRE